MDDGDVRSGSSVGASVVAAGVPGVGGAEAIGERRGVVPLLGRNGCGLSEQAAPTAAASHAIKRARRNVRLIGNR